MTMVSIQLICRWRSYVYASGDNLDVRKLPDVELITSENGVIKTSFWLMEPSQAGH